ncbi:enoyl-CoA hydratase [Mycobacterium lepraemurium]|nr:enoyl-CoA hydratase [Mycobacterium lepraemurium]
MNASAEHARYEKRGRIATITLDRPASRNAIDPAMDRRLRDIWAEFRDDDGVDVVILTGAGDAFCAGADRNTKGVGFGGISRLVDICGLAAALDLELSGEPIDAQRALQVNLVTRVVAHDDLMTAAHALAEPVVPAVERPANGSWPRPPDSFGAKAIRAPASNRSSSRAGPRWARCITSSPAASKNWPCRRSPTPPSATGNCSTGCSPSPPTSGRSPSRGSTGPPAPCRKPTTPTAARSARWPASPPAATRRCGKPPRRCSRPGSPGWPPN